LKPSQLKLIGYASLTVTLSTVAADPVSHAIVSKKGLPVAFTPGGAKALGPPNVKWGNRFPGGMPGGMSSASRPSGENAVPDVEKRPN